MKTKKASSPANTDSIKLTPEIIEAHGLTPDEFEKVKEILGREPSFTELGIFSVMWSEHCSYKNSKKMLRTFPTKGDCVIQGPGENAGVVDIGDGYAICFKIESHNHPSAVEPYQGAATGIGGILRDIFTMGARPIALVDPLRFGNPEMPRNRYIASGVISGIADYGNCVGVPTVAGDVYFADSYNGNPLINVMCAGLMKKEDLTLACARTPGNLVVYYGNSTGRDGIHGATFASEELSEKSEERRPAVQVGDPFMGKKILEVTLELIQKKLVEAIQDMGAAGLTCSSCEMAGRGDSGVEIDLDKVPQRSENLSAYEIMLSESQERMLAIVSPKHLPEVKKILDKWDLPCCILGKITNDGLMRVMHKGARVAEIPAARISTLAPEYSPESKRPSYLDSLQIFDPSKFSTKENPKEILLALLSAPTISSKRWIYEQYDHMVQLNTVVMPGSSSAVLRIKNTQKHIAITADCNGLMVYLDPGTGGAMAVTEAARNLVCSGAVPLAITNCLNFGNPTKPDIYYQFEQAVLGIGDACRILNTPVTGGNVSFYNENRGEAVFPTPVIGMIGLIEKPEHITTSGFKHSGDVIILIGKRATTLGGSQYYYSLKKKIMGPCPGLILEEEKKIQDFLLNIIRKEWIRSAQDISEGGLAVTLSECCILSRDDLGCDIRLPEGVNPFIELFSEDPSRIVITCDSKKEQAILESAEKSGVPAIKLGKVCGKTFKIGKNISADVSELRKAYESFSL
jgi:phosphoribosylformylglycinamidine synthase II